MKTGTVIKFTREKETKNTVRFSEQPEAGQPPIIGTLYIQKWAAADIKQLEITINFK